MLTPDLTPVENAKKRLAALKAEVEEIERFLALYEVFSAWGGAAPDGGRQPNSEENKTHDRNDKLPVDKSRSAPRLGPTPTELAQTMERVIRDVGRPMTRGELVDALERREINIPAKDKARYLGTIAWRHKGKFINIDGRGYWIRGELVRSPSTPSIEPEATEEGTGQNARDDLFG